MSHGRPRSSELRSRVSGPGKCLADLCRSRITDWHGVPPGRIFRMTIRFCDDTDRKGTSAAAAAPGGFPDVDAGARGGRRHVDLGVLAPDQDVRGGGPDCGFVALIEPVRAGLSFSAVVQVMLKRHERTTSTASSRPYRAGRKCWNSSRRPARPIITFACSARTRPPITASWRIFCFGYRRWRMSGRICLLTGDQMYDEAFRSEDLPDRLGARSTSDLILGCRSEAEASKESSRSLGEPWRPSLRLLSSFMKDDSAQTGSEISPGCPCKSNGLLG